MYKKKFQKKLPIVLTEQNINTICKQYNITLLSKIINKTTSFDKLIWKCPKGHEFESTYDYLSQKYLCFRCLHEEYKIDINVEMITHVFNRLYSHKNNRIITFIPDKQLVVNPKTKRVLKVHGYNKEANTAFQFIGPYDETFINTYHKSLKDFQSGRDNNLIRKQAILKEGINYHEISYKIHKKELVTAIMKMTGLNSSIQDEITKELDQFSYKTPKPIVIIYQLVPIIFQDYLKIEADPSFETFYVRNDTKPEELFDLMYKTYNKQYTKEEKEDFMKKYS